MDVAGVAVDDEDRLFVYNRGPHPVIVLDRDGRFLGSWGEDFVTRAHGIDRGPDGMLYLTDEGDHTVRRCTPEGEVLLEIGVGQPSLRWGGEPFHRCTHTALSPDGDIYVTDGYGNARVHKYAPDGTHLFSWGRSGRGEGEFSLPHNVACDADGWVHVADRENHRVQVFDGAGRFETQWYGVHRPSAFTLTRGPEPLCYVGEIGTPLDFQRGAPGLGPVVSVRTREGKLLARLGLEPSSLGVDAGQFVSPHGICVDSRGDVYVGEVAHTGWPNVFDVPRPRPLRALQKLVKV